MAEPTLLTVPGCRERLPGVARDASRSRANTRCPVTAETPSLSPDSLAPETYRAFFVALGGCLTGLVTLQAGSGNEAGLLARWLVEGEDVVELWPGLRTVARFEPRAADGLHAESRRIAGR